MNLLSHLYLSEKPIGFRIGNCLADLVQRYDRDNGCNEFARGLKCHQQIDVFADSHPIFKQSRKRISSRYRRFSGILVDVFYDYFLAINWDEFCEVPLREFTASFYHAGADYVHLPDSLTTPLIYISLEDHLGEYCTLEGVEETLFRISSRLHRHTGRQFHLERAVSELTASESELEQDFYDFFPDLRQKIADNWNLG